MRSKKLIKMEVTIYGLIRNTEDNKVPHVEVSEGETMFFNFVHEASPYKASEEFAKEIKATYLPESIKVLDIYAFFDEEDHWYKHKFERIFGHEYYSGEVEAFSAEEAREEMIDDISSAKMVATYTNEYYEGEIIASSPEEALKEMLHDIHSLNAVEVSDE